MKQVMGWLLVASSLVACPLAVWAEEAEPAVAAAAPGGGSMGLLLFIFVLAIFLGFELISKVPSQLHTPLMSGSNAISGITIVGALAAAGLGLGGWLGTVLGFLAVTFAAINVVGGYLVTHRMLGMFKQKKDGGAS
jgi:H+-translocating NAD(P) transhydrogenase subunit alpha